MIEFGNCEARIHLIHIEYRGNITAENRSITCLKNEPRNISFFTRITFSLLKLLKKKEAFPIVFKGPSDTIKSGVSFKSISKTRIKEEPYEYLSLQEINNLLKTGQELSERKKSIISDRVGLRWSDIEKLNWEEMEQPTEYKIRLKKSTKANSVNERDESVNLKELNDLKDENRRLRQLYNDLKARVEKEHSLYVNIDHNNGSSYLL